MLILFPVAALPKRILVLLRCPPSSSPSYSFFSSRYKEVTQLDVSKVAEIKYEDEETIAFRHNRTVTRSTGEQKSFLLVLSLLCMLPRFARV